jgi:hypothetical protein
MPCAQRSLTAKSIFVPFDASKRIRVVVLQGGEYDEKKAEYVVKYLHEQEALRL